MRTLNIEIGDCGGIKFPGIVARMRQKVSKNEPRIIFDNFDYFSRVMTKNNLELLDAIRKFQPQSIEELSARMKRRKSDISRTINSLADNGLIELRKINETQAMPIVHYDNILTTMSVGL